MLLALLSIRRKQTLVHLNISPSCMVKSENQLMFAVNKHLKQSRPNCSLPPVIIPRYTVDADVCPYVCLEAYLEKTNNLRQNDTLLIAMIRPHRAVGTQTLARWIKAVLQVGPDLAGICRGPRAYRGLALYCATPITPRTPHFSIKPRSSLSASQIWGPRANVGTSHI